jgi:ubiquinone/menaquinone biosynthesis C-methylase UbiE
MLEAIFPKYDVLLNNRGGLRALLKRYGVVRLLDAGMREAWIGCGITILRMLGRCPGNSYGWLEAVLFPTCDYWLRYARVVDVLAGIKPGSPLRLLEVSSGRGGIAWLVRNANFRTCLVDRDPDVVGDARGRDSWRVCADAMSLPFATGSFDVVISVDTMEHLPAGERATFVKELTRVAARAVVITCPLQSQDQEFRAGEFDHQLQQEIATRNGHVPAWLEQHLSEGHPTREQLLQLLPEARITGTQNCDVWLCYASLYLRPFGWLLAGLRYGAMLTERDAVPPYWRGTLVWEKHSLCSQSQPNRSVIFEPQSPLFGS